MTAVRLDIFSTKVYEQNRTITAVFTNEVQNYDKIEPAILLAGVMTMAHIAITSAKRITV